MAKRIDPHAPKRLDECDNGDIVRLVDEPDNLYRLSIRYNLGGWGARRVIIDPHYAESKDHTVLEDDRIAVVVQAQRDRSGGAMGVEVDVVKGC